MCANSIQRAENSAFGTSNTVFKCEQWVVHLHSVLPKCYLHMSAFPWGSLSELRIICQDIHFAIGPQMIRVIPHYHTHASLPNQSCGISQCWNVEAVSWTYERRQTLFSWGFENAIKLNWIVIKAGVQRKSWDADTKKKHLKTLLLQLQLKCSWFKIHAVYIAEEEKIFRNIPY